MNITTVVIDDEFIDDIFNEPKDYVDTSYDRSLVEIWAEDKMLFTVYIGMEESGDVYLMLEDDETSESFYPDEDETLSDVYERAVDKWIALSGV